MDWLSGIPTPIPERFLDCPRKTWSVNVRPEALPHYISAFERGHWDEPDAFPADELELLSQVKSHEDQLLIWDSFATPHRIQFPGDVLAVLMSISCSYPMPVVPENKSLEPRYFNSNPEGIVLHPGPPANLNVNLPERARVYEKYTDWSEHSSGVNFGCCPVFASVLDQLNLESLAPIGTPGYFPSVMRQKPIPWRKLGMIAEHYSNHRAVQIVKDWGLIMRDALGQPGPATAGQARWNLERAVLRFLVKRIAYDRLETV